MSSADIPRTMPGAITTHAHSPATTAASGKQPLVQHNCLGQDDRRRFQRAQVPLLGRFMRQNQEEYPCQITNASAGGLAVKALVRVEPNERIVLYVDALGRIEGEVVRQFEDGFALRLTASAYKREKIVNQLTWLVNRDKLSSIEDRQHDRFVPRKTKLKLQLPDGSSHDCYIVDVSLGGAAVIVEPQPAIGDLVVLGLTSGQVVRHSGDVTSIQFAKIQDPSSIERQFG